jgi:hypothetical protein
LRRLTKSGGPTTTSTQTPQSGAETRTFSADGFLTVAYNGNAQPRVNYQFASSTITITASGTATKLAVSELTATRLVYTQAIESRDDNHRVTSTFLRD